MSAGQTQAFGPIRQTLAEDPASAEIDDRDRAGSRREIQRSGRAQPDDLQGALPITGAKNAVQATQNASALGWRSTDEEVAKLDFVTDALIEPTMTAH